jgi:hypothetical protein
MALRTCSSPAVRSSRRVVRRPICASAAPHGDGGPSRRALLASAPALLLASILCAPALAIEAGGGIYTVDKLPKPFRKAQRQAYQKLLTTTLGEECKALDYRQLVRLLFNDAAAGGRDGSVHFRCGWLGLSGVISRTSPHPLGFPFAARSWLALRTRAWVTQSRRWLP